MFSLPLVARFGRDVSPVSPVENWTDFDVVWDAEDSAAISATRLAGNAPQIATANGWTITGWTAATVADESGEPGATALTESGIVARAAVLVAANNNMGVGPVRVSFSYRPGDGYNSHRYFLHPLGGAGAGHFVALPNWDAFDYPDGETGYVIYAMAYAGYNEGFRFTRRQDSKWIDCEYTTNLLVGETDPVNLVALDTRGVVSNVIGGVAITIANVTIEQERVRQLLPSVGKSEYAMVQGDDAKRLCWLRDSWFAGAALAEGYGNGAVMTAQLPVLTDFSLYSVQWLKDLQPAANKTVLALVGQVAAIELQQGPNGQWYVKVTDDTAAAATYATGFYVSPFPVCVLLTRAGQQLSLYVDGQLVWSQVIGVATVSVYRVFGGNTEAWWRRSAMRFRADTAAEIDEATERNRAAAGLPLEWDLVVVDGQSNATTEVSNTIMLWANGLYNRPGLAYWQNDFGYPDPPTWITDLQRSMHGLNAGIALELQQRGRSAGIINVAQGGAAIASWEPGGAQDLHVAAALTTATQKLGTRLFRFDFLAFVQGEADANAAGTTQASYESGLRTMINQARGRCGAQLNVALYRLNEWLGQNTTTPTVTYQKADVVRSAQDAVSGDALVSRARADGGSIISYNVHYPAAHLMHNVGRNLARARLGAAQRIEAFDNQYPQRGKWKNGGIWDVENGVTLAGASIVTVAPLEGTHALTAVGAPQMVYDPVNGKRQMYLSVGKYLANTSADWGTLFNGTKVPFIMFIQYRAPAVLPGMQSLFYVGTDDLASRAIEVDTDGAGNIAPIRYAGVTQTSLQLLPFVANGYATFVLASDGNLAYTFRSDGTIGQSVEVTTAMTGITKLYVGARAAGGLSNELLVRRCGIREVAAAVAYKEAVELATQVRGWL